MPTTLRPIRSRREFLLNRVGDLNRRVNALFFVAGFERNGNSLADEVTTGLQGLYAGRTGHHQSSDKVKRLASIDERHYPILVEDILFLILEMISPRINLDNHRTPNDITTLKSMRL
jgi:hypothetical protein